MAAAPVRSTSAGRLWLWQTALPHQQRRPIEQRGQTLWPVVALLSAAHHRFPCASSVVPVSARGSASPHAGAGEVHRQCFANKSQLTNCTTLRRATASAHGHQRGHARNAALCLSCAARCGATYQASPLCFARRSVGLASARGSASPRADCTPRLAGASCWISRSLRLGLAAVVFVAVVAHARCGHPLRFYIRPHFAKCSPVTALKLRLMSPTAGAPSRVHKIGLM